MAKAYYSTVFEQPAPEVWKIVRDFNNYPIWVGGAGESKIEDGKSGDTVGAVRRVLYQDRHIRQRLLAQSDVERSQIYEFCGAASLPVTGFQATLRITPIVDGDRAFIEWSATVRRPFRADLPTIAPISGDWAGSKATRSLLHSRCAFGIALPVAGARSPPISRMRV